MIKLDKILNIDTSNSIENKRKEKFVKCRKERKLYTEKLSELSGVNLVKLESMKKNWYI